MYAEVEEDACDLGLLLSNISYQVKERCVFAQSHEWTSMTTIAGVFRNKGAALWGITRAEKLQLSVFL